MQQTTTHEKRQATAGQESSLGWQRAWNLHDADALAVLVTRDVEFVTVAGLWLRGRQDFLAHHRLMHATQMRESTWTNIGATRRMLGGGHVLQHVEWRIEGDFDPDGTPRAPRRGIFTWVLQLRPSPLILAGNNANLASHLSHRLAGEAQASKREP
jgi:uncharacterized protein (TIGR02246 family)